VRSLRVPVRAVLCLCLLDAFCILVSAGAEPDFSDGLVRLDVVVNDQSGNPVKGLKSEHFTLLDNGQPQKLVSFRASDEATGRPDQPAEIVLVIDALNLSSQQLAVAEREAEKYLRQDQGRLAYPTMIYRLTDSSLSASLQPSTDGNALAEQVAAGSDPRQVWRTGGREQASLFRAGHSMERNESSLDALGSIAIEARRRPGRKVVVWIGPGWPADNVGNSSFDEIVEFSTRLREARISLYSVTAGGNQKREFAYEDFVKSVRIPKDAAPQDMALEVLSAKSGGRVMPVASNLSELIEKCAAHAGDYYSLTFDPPRAARADEYHELEVTVDKPDVSVRANSEYYDQPTFYDQITAPREQITVDQLQQLLESLRSTSDSEAARRLSDLELTNRLSRTRMEKMKYLVRGRKANEEFQLLADRSAFLLPPADEIPSVAAPSIHDQRLMLERTLQYLHDTIPSLPDLFATRTTVGYLEPAPKQDQSWKIPATDQSLHPLAPESVTVLIRNSQETTEKTAQSHKHTNPRRQSLTTEGTFGPMIAIVAIVGAAGPHSQITWSRWEQTPEGQLAVFRFTVPSESSHFETRYCCLADPDGTVPLNSMSAYHGEITIDPESGTVFRVTAQTDLPPRMPISRSDVAVEYGPISIGTRTYICPVRSVSISRSRVDRLLHQWKMSFGVYGPFESALNAVTFSDYHQFRSEHRILTDVPPTP